MAAASSAAEQTPTCEGRYHLLRPVPDQCMGPIETDRPHLTDTPAVTPPGHFALEVGLASFSEGREAQLPRAIQFLDALLKAGIWPGVDLQIGYAGLLLERGEDGYHASAGDSLYLRAKVQLWNGTGVPLAITLAPVLWAPLGAPAVEGGGTILVGAELPWSLEAEVNLSVFARYDEDGDGHHVQWIPTGAITRTIWGPLAGFVELYGETWREGDQRWVVLLDSGLLWLITRNLQLDVGARVGLTDSSPPYIVFVGASFRL